MSNVSVSTAQGSVDKYFQEKYGELKEELEVEIPQTLNSSKLIFKKDCVVYKNTTLKYTDIYYVSYKSVSQTYWGIVPIDNSYSYRIASETLAISINMSAAFTIGNKSREDAFNKLYYFSKTLVEPAIVDNYFKKLSFENYEMSVGDLRITRAHLCKKRFLFGDDYLEWKDFGNAFLSQGTAYIIKKDSKNFDAIDLGVSNAVILPELLDKCSKNYI